MSEMLVEITRVLSSDFDVPAGEIGPDSSLGDLGIDSVAAVELADVLRERYGIAIGDEELTADNTVAQVIELVAAKAGA